MRIAEAWARTTRAVRRRGLVGAVRLLGGRAVLREQHVWYELPLDAERRRTALPNGLELVRASDAEVELLDLLPSVGVAEARRRRAGGADLWLVLDGGVPLFSCWIFRGRSPALAARGGWFALPDGTACLEDSITAPAARGRGIAPAAWAGVASAVAGDGFARMVTKVETENAASRRAVEKAGFREIAAMTLRRTGPRKRVCVEPYEADAARFLEALTRP